MSISFYESPSNFCFFYQIQYQAAKALASLMAVYIDYNDLKLKLKLKLKYVTEDRTQDPCSEQEQERNKENENEPKGNGNGNGENDDDDGYEKPDLVVSNLTEILEAVLVAVESVSASVLVSSNSSAPRSPSYPYLSSVPLSQSLSQSLSLSHQINMNLNMKEDSGSVKPSTGIVRKVTTRTVRASAAADRVTALQNTLVVLLSLLTQILCTPSLSHTEHNKANQVLHSHYSAQ